MDKFLILSISILCMGSVFLFHFLNGNYNQKYLEKEYSTTIIAKQRPPAYKFLPFEIFSELTTGKKGDLQEKFHNTFKINLSSMDILQNYVDQNNEIDKFNTFLKKKNLTAREYFKIKMSKNKEKKK